jgi:ornithine carbamoyltransferase
MKHLLSLERLARADMERILAAAPMFKMERGRHRILPLTGQTWALIFNKSSTRTRVSFEVGIRELGGQAMFLSANDIQMGRGEPIKDTARVLGRMIHGAVIRTYAQSDVEEFALHAGVPTVNALTDQEHPCQVLSDIFTFQERRGPIQGKVVTFIGDGVCNMPMSWIFAAIKLGFELRIAAPAKYQPAAQLERLRMAAGGACVTGDGPAKAEGNRWATWNFKDAGRIVCTDDIETAASGADLLYTDVWVSMGKEAEAEERIKLLTGYQINRALVQLALPGVLVMHCLPAYRGKEIDEETFEANAQTIFEQAENRLHAQKAILEWAVSQHT